MTRFDPEEIDWDLICSKRILRMEAGRQSLINFMYIYLAPYVSFPFADFHLDLEEDLYDDEVMRILALMFRESAKSAICGLAYPLWCICYKKRNFIIYGSDEEEAAAANMAHLVEQLQGNSLIRNDFGELYYERRGAYALSKKKTVKDFVTANDIRVKARGVGQKVRGLRHNKNRPDLLLMDDIESLKNTGTKLQRDKIDRWIHSEALSGMNQAYGKAIMMANLLHPDAVAERLAKKKDVWKVHRVAVYDNAGKFAWPVRWVHTQKEADEINATRDREDWVVSVENVKADKGTLVFNQEYRLIPIRDEDQIVLPGWIKTYNKKFNWLNNSRYKVVMAVDPAISQKQSADNSAIGVMLLDKVEKKAYMLDYVNDKLTFAKLKSKIAKLYRYWKPEWVIVESVAAQEWLAQDLRDQYGIPVKSKKRLTDKRARLVSVSHLFEQGKVHFRGNQTAVIDQIVGFGVEQHDDLVDVVIDCLDELYFGNGVKLRKSKGGL